MVRRLFVLSICCFLMFLCGLVKAEDEIVAHEVSKRIQLYADVFLLKDGVERLQYDVEILKKKSSSQIDMLKDIKIHIENPNSNDDVCARISGFFNSTYRKYNMFEERIINKLDDIQVEQSTRLNKILIRQDLSKNCQQESALDAVSSAPSEIHEKIDKLETHLKSFESLEQKLKEQQDKCQALNDAQMKILNEMNEKLTQNQLKFDNLEKQMPNLKEMAENLRQISSQKTPRLPMDIILGLTQNQDTKPAV